MNVEVVAVRAVVLVVVGASVVIVVWVVVDVVEKLRTVRISAGIRVDVVVKAVFVMTRAVRTGSVLVFVLPTMMICSVNVAW